MPKKVDLMDSYNRFNRCVFVGLRGIFKIIGHDFFETFERNIISYTIYALMAVAVVSMAYSAIFYDPLTKIFNLLFFLIFLQVKYLKIFKSFFLSLIFFSFTFFSVTFFFLFPLKFIDSV